MEEQKLTILYPNGNREKIIIEYETIGYDYLIYYDNQSFNARTIFHAFNKMREVCFDPRGIKVLCNGARKNFILSGMAADMGDGFSGYIIKDRSIVLQLIRLLFKQRLELVYIFDYYDKPKKICSVKKQRRYINWLYGLIAQSYLFLEKRQKS
ncbi:MAG: hypothetical protein MK212_06755 [Saprospiraceae bacterium]|nr:hypothetical protein [Saprospiraceae bacterium]